MRTPTFLLLIYFLSFLGAPGNATTYYVKQRGGSSTSGLNDANAWSYSALAAKRLAPGDTVLLKRGDIFFGQLPTQSGTSANWIYYGAYGIGKNPVITGFTAISTWQPYSGSIYYADLTDYGVSNLNLVTLDGTVKGKGRYPNSGYLTYSRHSGVASITGTTISSLPFNATGSEAVIRKVRWILDRQPVTLHSASTFTLGATSLDGGAISYEGVDKNGYFIQNHLGTLDQEGEWYYDRSTRRLYMVLSAMTSTVNVSVLEQLVYLASKNYISFSDIDFKGSNTHGISMHGASNIAFNRCRFDQHGQTAIYGNNVSNITISNGTITNCLNNGVWVEWAGNYVKVDGMTVNNIGTIAGAGRSGDGAQQGIAVSGNNTTISNCTVTDIGYNGIQFNGSNARIENNLVDRFCFVKDDGGGIYTYENDGVTVANRIVRNNIVLHAVGTFAGAESYYYEAYGKAAGVYLDGNSNHTEVSNNVIAHGSWSGVFVNNNSWNSITKNLIYNHAAAIFLLEGRVGTIRNMLITGNECVARTASQKALYIKLYAADNPALMATYDNNFYARPVDDTKTITVDKQYTSNGTTNLTLAEWKAGYGVDLLSGKSAIKIDSESKILFDYNYSPTAKVITLAGDWKDIYSTSFQSSYTIPSYRGKVFLNAAGSSTPALPLKDNTFTATLTGASVTLNWIGYNDAASHYEVERSGGGANFSTIGVVDGRDAAAETAYTFVDKKPVFPASYYRLKVVESNGSVTYSKVLKVNTSRASFAVEVFPVPATTTLTVRFSEAKENLRLQIHDLSGRLLKELSAVGGQAMQQTVDISNLSKGQYLLSANGQVVRFSKL